MQQQEISGECVLNPVYDCDGVKIYHGNVTSVLREMPDESVNCCVTSPPYWGLRDYGTAEWDGGDPDCDHRKYSDEVIAKSDSTRTIGECRSGNHAQTSQYLRDCLKCGATRVDDQIGLEKTPEEYVAKMVEVFREVRRVLRSDGTCFINIGDSYAGYHGNKRVADDQAPSNKKGYWENMRPSSVSVRRGNVCDISGKEPVNYPESDCLCESLCDACRRAYRIGKSRNDSPPFPMPKISPSLPTHEHKESEHGHLPTSDSSRQEVHIGASTLDSERFLDHAPVPPHVSLQSMHSQSSLQSQEWHSEVSILDVKCLLCGCSLSRYVQEFVRKSDETGDESDCKGGSVSLCAEQENRSQYTCEYCSQIASYQDYTKPYLKPKDLVGIPWRVAFALQADGWYLRQDIIWAKPSPMPESVTDRCTKSHEYIFLLSKSARYHYNANAIKEPSVYQDGEGGHQRFGAPGGKAEVEYGSMVSGNIWNSNGYRNKRSVWTINTQPFPEAHFAVYPEALVRPCILAGCPGEGRACDCQEVIYTPTGKGDVEDPSMKTGRAGMNRQRRDDEGRRPITRFQQRHYAEQMKISPHREQMAADASTAFEHYIRTDRSGARPVPQHLLDKWIANGWINESPLECSCPTGLGGTVLDPFCGSGTTLKVARSLNCKGIGIELNADYIEIAKRRLRQDQFVFEPLPPLVV